MQLLNLLPNLKEVTFYDVEFSQFDANEILDLEKLKKFKFTLCNGKVSQIVCILPQNVLESLSVENSILDQLTLRDVFEKQPTLTTLEFDPYFVNPGSMVHLRFKTVKLMCNRNVAAILKKQDQLQSLDLSKAHISDVEFLELCNLMSLKTLKIMIDRVSWEILGNLGHLIKLKELCLNYNRLEVEYVSNIGRIKMPSVNKLKLKFPSLKISAESFHELSMNMENITHLNISNQSVGVLRALVESFKNLESLIIGCDSDSSEVVDFAVNDIRHDKLKELCIYNTNGNQKSLKCSKSILEIVNKSLRSLEKLKLQNVIALSSEGFTEIISNHSNLSHFFIDHPDGQQPLTRHGLML